MRRRGQSKRIIGIFSVFVAGAGTSLWAQERAVARGPQFTIDLGFGLSANTNEELEEPSAGTTTRSDLTAVVGYVNETESSRLRFSMSPRLEFSEGPNSSDGLDFRVSNSTLTYSREARRSRIDLTGRYDFSRVDDETFLFLDEDLNPVDVRVSGGDLRRTSLSANYSAGIDAPIGFDLRAYFDNRDYIETLDPDLYDRTEYGVGGTLRFRLSPVATGRLTSSYSRFNEDDLGERTVETFDYGAGVTYELDQTTEFSGDFSYTTIDETLFDVVSTENEGWSYRVGATRETPTGSFGGSIAQIISPDSTRLEILFDRARDLRDGNLSYSIGYSFDDGDGQNAFVGSLGYQQELRSGSLSADLSQRVATNDESEDTLVTRIGLNYTQNINSVSSFGVNFSLGRTDALNGNAEEDFRATLGLDYRREVSRDWDWVIGYQARYSAEDGSDPANGSRVYTRFDRSFSIRP